MRSKSPRAGAREADVCEPAPVLLEVGEMLEVLYPERLDRALEIDPISERRVRDAAELLARERDARRQLEAEKTVRERLLGTMTRELVTQANVAKGWLDLMRREHLDERARGKAFAKVDAALSAQLALLDELVGLSPAVVGHVNLDCRRVDVAAIARAVAADVGDERAHVIAPENAVVVADAEHLVRALRSLITATTRGAHSVKLHVTVSGDCVQVRFSNAIRDDDDALGIALRVAALYGGAVTVADGETVFELPIAAPAALPRCGVGDAAVSTP